MVQIHEVAPDKLARRMNSEPDVSLLEILIDCCDVPRWADEILAGRPYADDQSLIEAAGRVTAGLTAAEVGVALAAHPRIGDRAAGDSQQAGWSRSEQSRASTDDTTAQRLRAANEQYEEQFGRVFLICASGLSAEQILQAARRRLTNDPDTEMQVVAAELGKIASLRLTRALAA